MDERLARLIAEIEQLYRYWVHTGERRDWWGALIPASGTNYHWTTEELTALYDSIAEWAQHEFASKATTYFHMIGRMVVEAGLADDEDVYNFWILDFLDESSDEVLILHEAEERQRKEVAVAAAYGPAA